MKLSLALSVFCLAYFFSRNHHWTYGKGFITRQLIQIGCAIFSLAMVHALVTMSITKANLWCVAEALPFAGGFGLLWGPHLADRISTALCYDTRTDYPHFAADPNEGLELKRSTGDYDKQPN